MPGGRARPPARSQPADPRKRTHRAPGVARRSPTAQSPAGRARVTVIIEIRNPPSQSVIRRADPRSVEWRALKHIAGAAGPRSLGEEHGQDGTGSFVVLGAVHAEPAF